MPNATRHTLDYRSPGQRRPLARWWWALVALGLAVVGIAMVWCLEPKPSSHPMTNAGRDRSNLAFIGMSIGQFCLDHGGHYPDSLAELLSAQAMALDADSIVCPGSAETPIVWPATPTTRALAAALSVPRHVSYAYVGRAGWVVNRTPGDAVVAFESPAHFANGRFVLFADGTVDMVPTPRAARLIAAASASTRPVSAASVP